MLSFKDDVALEAFVADLEARSPKEKKSASSDRIIYRSREFEGLGRWSWGRPLLSDLGEARIVDEAQDGGLLKPCVVSPLALRAPETVLGMRWSYQVDVWMVGCLLFQFATGETPFTMPEGQESWSESIHLAQMVSLMGPSPAEFLERIEKPRVPCTEDSAWRKGDYKDFEFDSKLSKVEGKEKEAALEFMRAIFKWKPEERATPAQLLKHLFMKEVGTEGGRATEQSDADYTK